MTTALKRLALWALRQYSRVVATDAPDRLMLDITGTTHLHGGEAAMLADLVARLGSTGIAARVDVAPIYGAAQTRAVPIASRTAIGEVGRLIPRRVLPVPVGVRLLGLTLSGFDMKRAEHEQSKLAL